MVEKAGHACWIADCVGVKPVVVVSPVDTSDLIR